MSILTLEQVIQLHALLLASTGGADGIRDIARLAAAVATQALTVFGADVYDNPYHKAAALVQGIIQDHPFVDGNKRTGIMTGLIYLDLQGYETFADAGEIEDFAVSVATDQLEIEKIVQWLKKHVRPKSR